MKPIAVDIVLIPDAPLFDQALSINADLVKNHGSDIVLHATQCLPHISLAMGGLDPDDICHVKQKLHALRRAYPLDNMRHTTGLVYRTNSSGETTCSIELAKDRDLQRFHDMVMEHVGPCFKHSITEDMFVGDGPIAQSSLAWVSAFKAEAAHEHFWPHITLGYGKAEAVKVRDTFYVDSLKLCQLGNHCTCQKVLASV